MGMMGWDCGFHSEKSGNVVRTAADVDHVHHEEQLDPEYHLQLMQLGQCQGGVHGLFGRQYSGGLVSAKNSISML